MPALTASGNEITDASRALNTAGDGRSADSSFGVWEATTNLVKNGGGETNTAHTFAAGGGVVTITSDATYFKFGSKSFKVVTDGSTNNQGLGIQDAAGAGSKIPVTAGTAYSLSAWVRGTSGAESLQLAINWYDAADVLLSTTTGTNFTASASEMVRQALTATAPASAARAQVRVRASGMSAYTFYVDGVQLEAQPLATPYVPTDGATATRAAARVQAPASLLNTTQGWAAIRVRMGWGNTNEPLGGVGFPFVFDWRDTSSTRLSLAYIESTNTWTFDRYNTSNQAANVANAVSTGDRRTLIAAWTATQVKLSVDGASFVASGNTHIPTLAASLFDIGTSQPGGANHLDSDVLWFACGTGTLTDADAATIHGFGNTDKAPEDFIAVAPASACTGTWAADTSAYLDEAFTIIDPKGDGTSKNLLPHLKVEIDFTNDPTNATRVWTNVTGDVRDLSYVRGGRNHELQRTEAGTLNAILNNRHGKYDPSNAGSPYYPGVKRMRWVRVRARWGVTDYTRWTGLIEVWKQRWPGSGKDAVVEIGATDTFKVLNLFDLAGLSYGAQGTGARVSAVRTDAAVTAGTIDTGASTIVASGTFAEDSFALPHLLEVEESENGLLFAEADGGITFQNRHYRLLNSATSVATIGEQGGEIPYRDAEAALDDADVYNIAAVTPSGGTAEVASDSTSQNAHFKRRLSRSILVSSQAEALSAAQYLVGRYGDPAQRIPDVELLGVRDTTKWPTILAAKNSQRYTFKRRASASTISADVFVERVGDRVAPGTAWDVRLQLSPTDAQSGWVLGDSTYSVLGSTTRLVY